MIRSLRRFTVLLSILVVGAACSDQLAPLDSPLTPAVEVGGPYLSLSPAELTVQVLERSTPLAEDIVVSRVIGSTGGTILIPQAGLSLHVPAGALSQPTEISVRAHAGALVAYSFEPHGTQFAEVVSARQSLEGTLAADRDVQVAGRGYFADVQDVRWDANLASVTELSLVREDVGAGSIEFYLNHFSGYLIAID